MYQSINMQDIVEDVKRKTELNTEKRIREKLIEIFEMMDINRNLLKKKTIENDEGGEVNEYIFPIESKEFLNWLVCSFKDSDIKEMRRGNFHKANIGKMKKILSGFEEMFRKMELSESVIKQQIAQMYARTKVPFWEGRQEILDILKDMMRDLEVETIAEETQLKMQFDREELKETFNKYKTDKFRYFKALDCLDKNDQLFFMDMMCKDYIKLQQRHRGIYSILSEIRSEEVSEIGFDKLSEMSSKDEDEIIEEMNYRIAVQNELNENQRYRELMDERGKVLTTNGFVKTLQPKFKKICDEIKQIDEETQIRMFGELVVYNKLEKIDLTNRRTSAQALEEAIENFEEQEASRKEHVEKMAKITPKEWEEIRININAIMAEKGIPLIEEV